MRKIIIPILTMFCIFPTLAQDNYFFPAQKGAELTYKYYNGKGKILKDSHKQERWMKFAVDNVWPSDNGAIINVTISNETLERSSKVEYMAKIAEELSYGDVKIEGDSVILDNIHHHGVIKLYPGYMDYAVESQKSKSGNKEDKITFRVEASAISTYSRNMKAGDELPDQEIFNARYIMELSEEAKAEMNEMQMQMQMQMRSMGHGQVGGSMFSQPVFYVKATMTDRKVEAMESVETPAGTFECFRVSYKVAVADGMEGVSGRGSVSVMGAGNMTNSYTMTPPEVPSVKYIEWISPELGLIKREKYNSRGNKVEEVMQLESYTK